MNDTTESADILDRGLCGLGIDLDAAARLRLLAYCRELLRWARKINLVARAPLAEIWEAHFLDSLTLLPLLQEERSPGLLDIGTGAGFPGLVLKAAWPELEVDLVEPREKRVSFLRHVIRTLGLGQGSRVLCARLEKRSDQVAGLPLSARWITSRAFTAIADFLLHTEAVSPPGGRVICMKGPRAEEEIALWQCDQPDSPYRLEEIHRMTLPFTGRERNLVVFVKKPD